MGGLNLHLGCGKNLLPGWVNVDGDSLPLIAERYGISRTHLESSGAQYLQAELDHLPFPDGVADKILIEGVLEHLSFVEEKAVWEEMTRVLKVGGQLELSVPDFDALTRMWLEATDNWKGWFTQGAYVPQPKQWFCQGEQNLTEKWGYLVTCFFGNQTTPHQFHRNAYTKKKIEAVCRHLGLEVTQVGYEQYKGEWDPMIRVVATKTGTP